MSMSNGRKLTGRCPQFSQMYADRRLLNICGQRTNGLLCFQNNRVHASGKWSSTTGAPPRTVRLEEIKNRLTPIGLDGVYFLRYLM